MIKKKRVYLSIVLIASTILCACSFKKYGMDKKEIFDFVIENAEKLESFAQETNGDIPFSQIKKAK